MGFLSALLGWGDLGGGVPPAPPPLASQLSQTMPVNAAGDILLLDTPGARLPLLGLGCAWEVVAVNVEPMAQEQLDHLAMQHAALVRNLPLGSCVQDILHIAPTTRVPVWEPPRVALMAHPFVRAQARALATGLPHRAGTMQARLRQVTHLVTLRWPLPDTLGPPAPLLKTLVSRPFHAVQRCRDAIHAVIGDHLPVFEGLRQDVENTLRGCGHTVRRLETGAVGAQIARLLNPFAPGSPLLPEYALRDQVLDQDAQTIEGGWAFGVYRRATQIFEERYRAQVLSLHRVPMQTYPGILTAPRLPRESEQQQPMALWDVWDGPLSIVMNAIAVDQAAEQTALDNKGRIAAWQQYQGRNKDILEQIDEVSKHRFLTHEELGAGRMHLVLWGQEAAVTHGVRTVQNATERFRIKVFPEPDLGATLFLQTLPLGCNPVFPSERSLRRLRKWEMRGFVDMLGLYGVFRGTPTATEGYLNRMGEWIGFDQFDSPTNAHGLTVATSGGGKTYATGVKVSNLLALGHKVILFDPLRNYRALCAFWHGTYIRMNFEAPPCLNPFYGPLDSTHQGHLAASINERAGSRDERLSWAGFNILSDALAYFAETWDAARGEPFLRHFVTEVLQEGRFTTDPDTRATARRIAERLLLWYGRGVYAQFGDGPNTFQFGEQLTVIELQALEKAEKLQAILFFDILHLLPQMVKAESWRRARKYIIADELYRYLSFEETAKAVESMILTYRNYDISVNFLAQLAEHLTTPVGKVIAGIAEHVLFLKQHASEFPAIAQVFNLSEDEQALFKQGHIEKHDTWSSGYLRLSSQSGGIVRILGDPITHLLMTQEKEVRLEREAVLDAHPGDEHGAILHWLRTKGVLEAPHG